MIRSRLATRTAAVALTASALSVAAAGAASATTVTNATTDTSISVTFSLEQGDIADVCFAALTTPAHAAVLGEKFTSGAMTLADIAALTNDKELIVLQGATGPLAAPNLATGPATVTATNVPANVYTLITYCTSKKTPGITPVTIGNPIAIAQGSMQSMSADGAPAAMSSMLGKMATGGMLGGTGS